MDTSTTKLIVLFDGVCNLCHTSVTFIIEHDPKDQFRFASLQSEFGQTLAAQHGIDSSLLSSIILINGDKAYTESTAALTIAKHLKGLWPVLAVFLVVPRFIRDRVYHLLAGNRYRIFGRAESCLVPTPALQQRFLDA